MLIDTEQETDHMRQLGQVAISREDYVESVHRLRDDVVQLPTARRPVAHLVP